MKPVEKQVILTCNFAGFALVGFGFASSSARVKGAGRTAFLRAVEPAKKPTPSGQTRKLPQAIAVSESQPVSGFVVA
jgi:hypothetical protein